MGRWFVILLAVTLTMGVLFAYFPTLKVADFHVGATAVKWYIPLVLGLCFTYHKLSGK